MTAPAALVAFALAVQVVGVRLLPRTPWTRLSPRWGIWAWQAVTLTAWSALILAGVALEAPVLPIATHLAQAVRTTPFEVTEHYSTPAGESLALLALAITTVAVTATVVSFLNNVVQSARRRRQQIDALTLVGTPHAAGFTLLESSTPIVYCLPGRHHTVVITRAALEVLSTDELQSVLAHERRHLRERHDLAMAWSDALARVFGRLSVFRVAQQEIGMLVEMQADDAASSLSDRRSMARALLALQNRSGAPAGVAFSGIGTAVRVRRLVDWESSPMRWQQRLAIGAASAALMAMPVALALAPAVEAAARGCCPSA